METEEASEENVSREGISETEKAMEVGLDKAGGTIRFSSSMDWEENENSTMDWAKTSAGNNSDGTSGTEEEQSFAAEKNQGGQTEEAFSVSETPSLEACSSEASSVSISSRPEWKLRA